MRFRKIFAKIIIVILLLIAIGTGAYFAVPSFRDCVDWLYDQAKALISGGVQSLSSLYQGEGEGTLVDEDSIAELEDSGITGEDCEDFDTTLYPYYGFLSETEQALYKQLYANIAALETTFVPVVTVTQAEVQNAVESIFCDHPEFFWLETSYSYRYTEDGTCVQITINFNETVDSFDLCKYYFDTISEQIISYAQTLDSDYAKEQYVHDAILQLTEYDDAMDSCLSQSSYSALVMGHTVCAGYARAFQYIMTQLEIPTYFCVGYATEDHAWNIVLLSDGYYNVDLTWDDSSSSYRYFNIPDSEFLKSHTRTGLSTLLPECTGTAYYTAATSGNSGNSDTSGSQSLPSISNPALDSSSSDTNGGSSSGNSSSGSTNSADSSSTGNSSGSDSSSNSSAITRPSGPSSHSNRNDSSSGSSSSSSTGSSSSGTGSSSGSDSSGSSDSSSNNSSGSTSGSSADSTDNSSDTGSSSSDSSSSSSASNADSSSN